ncbi:hypothetical protein Tco_1532728 [Tanacetum coccineum]
MRINVRFQRSQTKTSSYNNDLHSRNDRLPNVTYSGNIRGSFASILKEGTKKQSVLNPLQSTLVLDDSFLKEHEENKFEDKDIDNVKGDIDVEKFSKTSGIDPFNIYELLQKKKDSIHQTKKSDPTHPPGFTPELGNNIKEGGSNSVNDQRKSVSGLGYKAKKEWIKELCSMQKINFVALQETKMKSIDLFSINMLWGNLAFDHAVSSSIDYFLAIMGTWTPTSTKLLVISVYAPQELSEKREL